MKSYYKASGMPKCKAGFCAIFNNTINVCKYHYETFENDDVLILNEEINKLFYTKKINNSSEFLFDLESSYDNSKYPNPSNAHVICDHDLVKEKNKIFNIFFKLKDIEDYDIEKDKYIDENTLSIHIRGTDKSSEINPPDLNSIFRKIDNMISINNIKTIFLATDDIFYLNNLKLKYGDMIKYRTEKKISTDGRPIHFIDDRTIINKELMIDVYLLSQSKYFLYCFSNVSYLALTIGINSFNKIDCLNS